MRVIVVEDGQIVAEDLRSHLGSAAIRLTEELQSDLVVMDVRLQSEMDGVDAARRHRLRAAVDAALRPAWPKRLQ